MLFKDKFKLILNKVISHKNERKTLRDEGLYEQEDRTSSFLNYHAQQREKKIADRCEMLTDL